MRFTYLGIMMLGLSALMTGPVSAQEKQADTGFCMPDVANKEPCEFLVEVWNGDKITVGRLAKHSGKHAIVKDLKTIAYPKDAPRDYRATDMCEVHGKKVKNVFALAQFDDELTDRSQAISHAWMLDQNTGVFKAINPVQYHVVCYSEMP